MAEKKKTTRSSARPLATPTTLPPLPHSILYPDFETFWAVHRESLTAGGIHLALPKQQGLRQAVEVRIGLAREREQVALTGEVLWVGPAPDTDGRWPTNLRLPPAFAESLIGRAATAKLRLTATKENPANPAIRKTRSSRSRHLETTTKRSMRAREESVERSPGAETQKRMIVELDEFLKQLEQKLDGRKPAESEKSVSDANAGESTSSPAAPLRVVSPSEDSDLVNSFDSLKKVDQIRVAMSGGRVARGIVVRKGGGELHRFLLQNPRITETEVAAIAALPAARVDILELIGRNKEWTRAEAVCVALVTNMKCPVPLAMRLAPSLSEAHLRRLAKARELRGPIDGLVRRLLAERRR